MRIIIELPYAAGETATVRQEASSTTVEAPSGPTVVTSDRGAAQDGGSPAKELLYALGAEQTSEGEASPRPVKEAENQDGGDVAPWLVDLITGGAQG